MKRLIASIIVLSIHSATVAAEWKIDQRIDAMTDEVRKTAVVKNESGHTFSIYRVSKDGAVWGNFSLSDTMFDQVDWKRPPIYRIDKNEPVDLAKMKRLHEMGLGIKAYEWEPKWVNFVLWHGKQDQGMTTDLVRLMEGEKLVFRYYLGTGGYKETSFSLKGAAPVIADAIGISQEIDHAAQQKVEVFNSSLLDETKRCRLNMQTNSSCFKKVNECRKQAEHDIDKFKSCLQ